MSADNIYICPDCGEYSLREYTGMGINPEKAGGKQFWFSAEYRAECRECGWEWSWTGPVLDPMKEPAS